MGFLLQWLVLVHSWAVQRNRGLVWIGASMVIAILAYIYRQYSPMNGYFPKCPFRLLTGWQCAGCGSQRAVHHLLNGEWSEAFHQNPLLVISIPYLLLGYLFEWRNSTETRWLQWRKRLFGQTAIWVIFGVILAFGILRNIIAIP